MERLAWLFVVLCLGVATTTSTAEEKYTVKKGDNLWTLSEKQLSDPWLWPRIVEKNPWLKEPGRIYKKNGRTYVVIKPGEKLVGFDNSGNFVPEAPTAPQPALEAKADGAGSSVWWWLLALALALIAAACLLYAMIRRNPVTSGPAVVKGGVTRENADAHFQRMAAESYQRTARTAVPHQQFAVLETTPGRISGVLNVRYGDGKVRPRQVNGERAYCGRVRFPDGHEETLYMLQACGNDLRYGGIARYLPGPAFRFEPEQTALDETPLPIGPATQRSVATPSVAAGPRAGEQGRGEVTIELKPADANQPALLRVKGGNISDVSLTTSPDGFTLRYRPSSA